MKGGVKTILLACTIHRCAHHGNVSSRQQFAQRERVVECFSSLDGESIASCDAFSSLNFVAPLSIDTSAHQLPLISMPAHINTHVQPATSVHESGFLS
jgi:hypothetical protein